MWWLLARWFKLGYSRTYEESSLSISDNILCSSDLEEGVALNSYATNKYFTLIQSITPTAFLRLVFDYKNLTGTIHGRVQLNGVAVSGPGFITNTDWTTVVKDVKVSNLKRGDVFTYEFYDDNGAGRIRNCRILGCYSPFEASEL
jgi:hypothetical protein